jgi:hypothetical protein
MITEQRHNRTRAPRPDQDLRSLRNDQSVLRRSIHGVVEPPPRVPNPGAPPIPVPDPTEPMPEPIPQPAPPEPPEPTPRPSPPVLMAESRPLQAS